MLTFNIQADNGNYYFGHEPGNGGSIWTGDQWKALVLTIEQARELLRRWTGVGLRIMIAVEPDPINDAQFQQELFCARGDGNWYDYVAPEEVTV